MPEITPNPRGAEFWNSTMGHAWVSQQAVISDVFTSVTNVSLDAASAKRGEHVVDIGCGTGDTLLAFAKAVGPSGAALGVDISAPMLDLAKHRAAEAEFGNVTCALADATIYPFEPRWADLVYSRFGLMFFGDPAKAFANIRSGMKADGRLVFVCFRTMPESPWFRVPIEAARPHLPPQPPADPLAPGMFSFAREERVRGILAAAGFREIAIKPTDVPIHGKDVTQSMAFITQAGPLPALLENASDEQRHRAIDAVRNALAAGIGADGRSLHVGLWLVSALA
ncbi:class I SAM-dependent methyltransferase [Bradyrhizobium sp. CCBAU 51753]|uniref:class I SAM-dependent methyltransferase n=1 Tax=Bradyrhizobium sp. CCBAU 51753 TaxID=1325100 RepID=UPI00188C63F7|nr:methyltransferase domain-containing protein [Bradyrhizobium sp. CCBAU 51753]QOZ23339.1 SAM-dependent methyltransferase [Bradyrhizobium sp. CCBAU 51753]